MDLGIVAALALLIVWAAGALFIGSPGWINLFLTLGVFLLIWRLVVRKGNETPKSK